MFFFSFFLNIHVRKERVVLEHVCVTDALGRNQSLDFQIAWCLKIQGYPTFPEMADK